MSGYQGLETRQGDGGVDYKEVAQRTSLEDRTVLYLDCGGSYRNLHMWKNCTEVYTHKPKRVHVKLLKSDGLVWIVSTSLSWFCCCTLVTWDVTHGGNWKGTWDLSTIFATSHKALTISKLKVKQTNYTHKVKYKHPTEKQNKQKRSVYSCATGQWSPKYRFKHAQ